MPSIAWIQNCAMTYGMYLLQKSRKCCSDGGPPCHSTEMLPHSVKMIDLRDRRSLSLSLFYSKRFRCQFHFERGIILMMTYIRYFYAICAMCIEIFYLNYGVITLNRLTFSSEENEILLKIINLAL